MSTSNMYSSAIYLDLEWNCHDFARPGNGAQDIIEIGLVQLDLSLCTVIREASFSIRPRFAISRRCTRITGITWDELKLKNALPFRDAVGLICAQWPEKAKWVSWGNDGDILARSCQEHRIGKPFRRCLDLSRLFQDALALSNQPSLRSAMDLLGVSFDGYPHIALVDARNTARLHSRMIRMLRDRMVGADPSTENSGGCNDTRQQV